MNNCPVCGAPLDAESLTKRVCAVCGEPLPEGEVIRLSSSAAVPKAAKNAFSRARRTKDAPAPVAVSTAKSAPALTLRRETDGWVVTGASERGTRLAVPDEIDGIPVVEIDEAAFRGRPELAEVALGDRVARVGDRAFEGCRGLTFVSGGADLVRIGEAAFRNCPRLTDVALKRRADAYYSSFAGCYALGTLIERELDLLDGETV